MHFWITSICSASSRFLVSQTRACVLDLTSALALIDSIERLHPMQSVGLSSLPWWGNMTNRLDVFDDRGKSSLSFWEDIRPLNEAFRRDFSSLESCNCDGLRIDISIDCLGLIVPDLVPLKVFVSIAGFRKLPKDLMRISSSLQVPASNFVSLRLNAPFKKNVRFLRLSLRVDLPSKSLLRCILKLGGEFTCSFRTRTWKWRKMSLRILPRHYRRHVRYDRILAKLSYDSSAAKYDVQR